METLLMCGRERVRLEVMGRVKRKEITLAKAAGLLKVSYRQVKRVYARYRANGDRGLVHGLRGRKSNRRRDGLRQQAVSLYARRYADFGPTLASEYMARKDGLEVGVETLRQWLLAEGLWQRRRQRKPHRLRRPRREHCGELVQMDGSHHDWFEGRRGWAVLMVMIDDATSRVYARFSEQETTVAAMEIFGRYVRRHGLPRALYVDRDSIYRTDREPTFDEALEGQEPRTQFGRAMYELGVEVILAGSPQAKGRVERSNGTLQHRLVKALRHEGISDLARANAYLENGFLDDLNRRFSVVPSRRADVHRCLPVGAKLEHVLAIREERVVQNDWTVRWHNRWLQVLSRHRALQLPGRRVIVCEQLDGALAVLYQGKELTYEELPATPHRVEKAKQPLTPDQVRSKQGRRPRADHPWYKPFRGG